MPIITQPTNFNFAKVSGFRFVLDRTPNTVYFLQSASLPGISLPEARQPTSYVDLPIPGDNIEYEPLNLRFKVDENLENYRELYGWMRGLGGPVDRTEYKNLVGERYPYEAGNALSDATLIIETAAHNPNIEVNFKNLWPTSLSQIEFNTTTGDEIEIDADASFRYSYYDIKVI